MMRKHPAKDMAKASLWMTKAEYKVICDMSGSQSVNSFLMNGVRKLIAAAEQEQGQERKRSAEGYAVTKPSNPTAADDEQSRGDSV